MGPMIQSSYYNESLNVGAVDFSDQKELTFI